MKNNLQTIASLLRLQARRSTSPEVQAALRESVNRILSISVVHEFLSQQDAEIIDVAEVARNILETVSQNMLEPEFDLNTELDGNGHFAVRTGLAAWPWSLTNSFKIRWSMPL